jgi:hypothetical protein
MNPRPGESASARMLRLELLARHHSGYEETTTPRRKGFYVRIVRHVVGAVAARPEPRELDNLAHCRAQMALLRTRLEGRQLFTALLTRTR